MSQSPRRPLILKRRKRPFPKSQTEDPRDEPGGAQNKAAPAAPDEQGISDTIHIVDHMSMPDTQVVVIPKAADLQSVIDTLSAKSKGCGPQGLHKFILLSEGSGCSEDWPSSLYLASFSEEGSGRAFGSPQIPNSEGENKTDCPLATKLQPTVTSLNKEQDSSPLNDSLTNIQWLGRICSAGLGSGAGRRVSTKEDQEPVPQRLQLFQHLDGAQRPPFSYMAMIQFAINSKPDRRMTLKEIYTWIEDHFPYFRDVAKPGWKNSIRHNLSMHHMFTRDLSGRTSVWTIHPEANRCLTLDQVNKHQKPAVPQVKKVRASVTSERKMRAVLPQANPCPVPKQFSLNPALFLPSPHLAVQQNCGSSATDSHRGGKRVRNAPKCAPLPVGGFEDPLCVSLACDAPVAPPQRRKQCLAPPQRRKQCLAPPSSSLPKKCLAPPSSSLPKQCLAPPSSSLPKKCLAPPSSSLPKQCLAPPSSSLPKQCLAPPSSSLPKQCLAPPSSSLPKQCLAPPSSSLPKQCLAPPHRRKQCQAPPSREEPVLLFPNSSFDSVLTCDLGASQHAGSGSLGRISSTPSKPLEGETPASLLQTWSASPPATEGHGMLDFSPIRSPLLPSLALEYQNHGTQLIP